MGYREDFINRLRDEGLWDHLSGEQRREYEQFSDEQAGRIMGNWDWWLMGDPEINEQIGMAATIDICKALLNVFQGQLLQLDGENVGRLSKAGMLLAELIAELEERGLNIDTVAEDFPKLNNPMLIVGLRLAYKKKNER